MRKKTGERKTRACKACPLSAICYVTAPTEALRDIFLCTKCDNWWTVEDHDGVRGKLLAVPWEPCDTLTRLHKDMGWRLDRCPHCVPTKGKKYAAEVVYEAWRFTSSGKNSGQRKTMRLRVMNEPSISVQEV